MFNQLGMLAELIKNAGKLRDSVESLSQLEVEGESGGGAVTVKVSGRLEVMAVHIDPKLVADGDSELLEDLVMAAVNAGLAKARDAAAQSLASVTGGLPAGLLSRTRRAVRRQGKLTMAGPGFSAAVDRLVAALGRLPGIGAKSAERLAHHLAALPRRQKPSSLPRPSVRPSSGSATARSASTLPRPTSPSAPSAATPAATRQPSASSNSRATSWHSKRPAHSTEFTTSSLAASPHSPARVQSS